jgi:hypothetical protein
MEGLGPEDLKERKTLHRRFQDIVRQQMKDDENTDWGAYVGEMKGFCNLFCSCLTADTCPNKVTRR